VIYAHAIKGEAAIGERGPDALRKSRMEEEIIRLLLKNAYPGKGVEQYPKSLRISSLQKSNLWNPLSVDVLRHEAIPEAVFRHFGGFFLDFRLLFTSYSHRAGLSSAVRR